VSKDGASCDTAASPPSWQEGWIVYANPDGVSTVDTSDPLLRVQSAFGGSDTFDSGNSTYAITFNRDGFVSALGAASLTITLHDSTDNSVYTRCLNITQAGMMVVQTHSSEASCT
jgi:Tfp pilus assembly protein FimT